jgi:riboflavin synthase
VFTGIVQAVGSVAEVAARGGDLRLIVDAAPLAQRVQAYRLAVGESIAVNGACLTIVQFDGQRFVADVSRETLALTTLGRLAAGTAVNLEAALRMGDPLGGHMVAGHIDGVAEITAVQDDARSLRLTVSVPAELARFIAAKGSVALDGISLTVNEVEGRHFGVNLIPHTREQTTLREVVAGRLLNLEVDMLARYAQRALRD